MIFAALVMSAALSTNVPVPAPAPRPLQASITQQSAPANSNTNQDSASNPTTINQINITNPKPEGAAEKDAEAKDNSSWQDWFYSNDHWVIIGTLILAGAAIAQVEVARRTAKRQLRAYVLIDGGNVYDASRIGVQATQPNTLLPQYANFIAVDLTLKNSGQTPASHVLHWAQIAISDAANEHLLIPPSILEETQASVVGPGQIITKGLVSLPFPLTPPVLGEIITHDKGIYVYGKVIYRDIFKRTRMTTYRLRYSGQWPPIPSGNFLFSLKGNDFT